MKYNIDIIKELLKSEESWIIIVGIIAIIIGIILFNSKNIYFFLFDTLKKAKVKDLEDVVKLKSFDKKTKSFLKEYLECEKFKMATGVNWSKDLRLEILKICADKKNNLYFDKFKRASYYVKYNKPEILIDVNNFEKVGFYFNLIIGIIFIFTGLISIVFLLQLNLILTQILTLILLSLGFIFFGYIMVRDAAIIKNAFDIQKELLKKSKIDIQKSK